MEALEVQNNMMRIWSLSTEFYIRYSACSTDNYNVPNKFLRRERKHVSIKHSNNEISEIKSIFLLIPMRELEKNWN